MIALQLKENHDARVEMAKQDQEMTKKYQEELSKLISSSEGNK